MRTTLLCACLFAVVALSTAQSDARLLAEAAKKAHADAEAKKLPHPPVVMRPKTTAKLTPENFDEWVHNAVDSHKTAFVRWMQKDDATNNCTWVQEGFMHLEFEDKEEEAQYVQEHGDIPKREHPCTMVRKQAEAWNALTKQYEHNDKVVFGDIVVSDWPEKVKEVAHLYAELEDEDESEFDEHDEHEEHEELEEGEHEEIDEHDEHEELDGDAEHNDGELNDGEEPHHDEDQYEHDEHDPENLSEQHDEHQNEHDEHDPENLSEQHDDDEQYVDKNDDHNFEHHERPDWVFGKELAEVVYDDQVGGCTVRHYNMENGYENSWSPHCYDLLEMHDVEETHHIDELHHEVTDDYDGDGDSDYHMEHEGEEMLDEHGEHIEAEEFEPPESDNLTPEEEQAKTGLKPRMMLETYVVEEIENNAYMLQELDHWDQL